MDVFKTQLERLQKQLAGLSATQRMLTATLAAIMVITVIWWGKYAAESETVALLPEQSFSADELGGIEHHLDEKGIHYSVSGGKLMVPVERRMEILSDLTYSRLMPHNIHDGFEALLKEMNPFDSQQKQDRLWNHGTEMLVAQIIGSFPDVEQADVIINSKDVQRIEGGVPSSATVNIRLRDGVKPSQNLVDAAANAVAGADQIDLKNIKVLVNGASKRVHDTEDQLDGGDDQLTLLQKNENWREQKVREIFPDIQVYVNVTMKLNVTSVQTEKDDFDGKGAVQKTLETTNETSQTTGPPPGGGEAGTVPNTMVAVGPTPSAGGGGQTTEKTQEKNVVKVPETHTVSHTPAGEATPVAASVRMPLSYFARLEHISDPTLKDPTFLQLKPLIDQKLPELRDQVARTVGLASANDVSMDWYPDAVPLLSATPAAASSPGFSMFVGGHAKELGLGALALTSLFMASMMVKKSTPTPVPATVAAAGADGKSSGFSRDGMVGEATSVDGLLDGLELNEETVRTTQMVNQVSTMVRENPEAAAALVKRWLNRT